MLKIFKQQSFFHFALKHLQNKKYDLKLINLTTYDNVLAETIH